MKNGCKLFVSLVAAAALAANPAVAFAEGDGADAPAEVKASTDVDQADQPEAQPEVGPAVSKQIAEATATDQAHPEAGQMLDSGTAAAPALSDAGPVARTQSATSGYCGDTSDGKDGHNIRWSFSNGTLTLTGSGSTDEYSDPNYVIIGTPVVPEWREAGLADQITSVDVGGGITELGQALFQSLPNLRSARLPSSLRILGNSVFKDCANLTSISLNQGLQSIGGGAFDNTGIRHLNIPSSVQSIDSSNFGTKNYMSGLSRGLDILDLNIASDNPYLSIKNNILYSEGGKKLLHASNRQPPTGHLDVPYGVEELESQCLSNLSITSVTLPNTLKKIGSDAFFGSQLKSVTIPDSVTEIEWGAFGNMSSLESAVVGSGLKTVAGFNDDPNLRSVTIAEGPTTIDGQCFRGSGLQSVTLPDSIQTLEYWAFWRSKSLETIRLGPNVKTIGDGAFQDCTSLRSINIPNGVTRIGVDAIPDGVSFTVPAGLSRMSDGSYEKARPFNFTVTHGQTAARSMLQMVNDFRASNATYQKYDGSTARAGALPPLTYDYTLEKLAERRAVELVVRWSHDRPDGTSTSDVVSGYSSWGENIAAGQQTPPGRDERLEGGRLRLRRPGPPPQHAGNRRQLQRNRHRRGNVQRPQLLGPGVRIQEVAGHRLDVPRRRHPHRDHQHPRADDQEHRRDSEPHHGLPL